jgi:hypothetical protein
MIDHRQGPIFLFHDTRSSRFMRKQPANAKTNATCALYEERESRNDIHENDERSLINRDVTFAKLLEIRAIHALNKCPAHYM